MRAAPTLLIPIAFVLVGCPSKAQQVGGVPRQGTYPKVVSLSPSTSEIFASNLELRMLVGRTAADDYPTSLNAVPVVASVKPDFEKIKATGATAVIYDADLYSAEDVKRIEGMGAESFAFKAHDVAGFERELYELAGKFGSETNVSGYVDRIERERSTAEGDPVKPVPKVAVVLGNGEYLAGTDSFVADVVRIAGGKIVGPSSGKFDPMSPEALVAASPDVIVLATTKASADKDIATLRANPRFAPTPAMKSGRIYALTQDVVLRRGGRVDVFIRDLHRSLALNAGAPK